MVRQWAGNVPEMKVSICKYMSGPEMARKWFRNGPEMIRKWRGNGPENGYKTPQSTPIYIVSLDF